MKVICRYNAYDPQFDLEIERIAGRTSTSADFEYPASKLGGVRKVRTIAFDCASATEASNLLSLFEPVSGLEAFSQ